QQLVSLNSTRRSSASRASSVPVPTMLSRKPIPEGRVREASSGASGSRRFLIYIGRWACSHGSGGGMTVEVLDRATLKLRQSVPIVSCDDLPTGARRRPPSSAQTAGSSWLTRSRGGLLALICAESAAWRYALVCASVAKVLLCRDRLACESVDRS